MAARTIFRLREHIERLLDSCTICTMDVPYTREQLMTACVEVVRANKMPSCYLRPLVYLGYGALGLGSFEPPVRTMVACYEWGAYLGDDGLKKGIKCMVSGFTRANSNAVMNKGKICGQYVTSVLAKRMAIKSGFDEALMLDPQGYVAEGTGENIFVVKHGVVRTPPTSARDPRRHHARHRRSSCCASRASRCARSRSRATSSTSPTRCS